MKFSRRFMAVALALIMVLGTVTAYGGTSAASAERSGYVLEATKMVGQYISPDTTFSLKTPEATTSEELSKLLSIQGQEAPEIVQKSDTSFEVVPSDSLKENTLCRVIISRAFQKDLSWAFQTAKSFRVNSYFPASQATEVPVNTGIEFTFSDSNYADIDSYFSISPEVKGHFERHGNTAAFVPDDPLNYATVYTVTLKAGVKNTAYGTATEKETVFSFETRGKDSPPDLDEEEDITWSVYFNSSYEELSSKEQAEVGLSYYYDYYSEKPDPEVSVYRFDDVDRAIDHVRGDDLYMGWTLWSGSGEYIEPASMENMGTFPLNEVYDEEIHSIKLPYTLSQGWYLIDIPEEVGRAQMILQITDLAVQVISDGDKDIYWVNDISTGKAAAGAKLSLRGGAQLGTTGSDGVIYVNTPDYYNPVIEVSAGEKSCILLNHGYSSTYYWGDGGNSYADKYWREFQLDRNLYKKDDKVNFWGYVKARKGSENVSQVTVAVSEGWSSQNVLCRKTVSVKDGSYSGWLDLPSVDSGYYCISVYKGAGDIGYSTRLNSEYFTVEEYVKPAYKIELSADKNAVFEGDTVNFTVKTAFYEGTPVGGLDVSYNSSYIFENQSGTVKTDGNGKAVISQKVKTNSYGQGMSWSNMGVYATLPEAGQISANEDVLVFHNDINVDIDGSRKGKSASLKVDANKINIDKINKKSDWSWEDAMGSPVAGLDLDVEIYRVYWEREKTGTYYNYVTKKTEPVYRYNRCEEQIDEFGMKTSSSGKATKNFSLPGKEYESYYAEITCMDGNGKTMNFTEYLGEVWDDYFYSMNSRDDYYLDGAEESYSQGDKVELTLKHGDSAVNSGNCLFVTMQDGIRSYKSGKSTYTSIFDAGSAPNIYVYAYYFNGYRYVSTWGMQENLIYEYGEKELDIQIKPDKASYEPGGQVCVMIKVKDEKGKNKKAHLSLAMVDQALFDLSDYEPYTLMELYASVGSGLDNVWATHDSYKSNDLEDIDKGIYEVDDSVPMESPSAENSTADSAASAEGKLRSDFKDTALAAAIDTDDKGEAVYSFTLPDNITSWRLTVSAISDDLYAGTQAIDIIATAPLLINCTLPSAFLRGDTPSAAVTAYGKGKDEKTSVSYEVWDEAKPDKKIRVSGKANVRTDIPLWQMNETGDHAIIIKAKASDGSTDMIRCEYSVEASGRTLEKTKFYEEVTSGMSFAADSSSASTGSGNSRIIFTDGGRGQFLCDLIGLTFASKMRLETAAAAEEAAILIKKYFPGYEEWLPATGCELDQYQKVDGGMALLPYGNSDLNTTIQVLPLILDSTEIDRELLVEYLSDIYNGDNSENRVKALYGLALLGQPVLNDLNGYAELAGLSAEDAVYVALAYGELGDLEKASSIYDACLLPLLENTDPYCRLRAGDTADSILDNTAAAMYLASLLGKTEAEAMFNYCVRNCSDEVITNVYKVLYIRGMIDNLPAEGCSVTYELYGDEKTQSFGGNYGRGFCLTVPEKNIDQLDIKSVSGKVSAVKICQAPVAGEAVSFNNDITIKRRFYRKGSDTASQTFAQGDIVKVNLWVEYGQNALRGGYEITDFLPAGLAYVNDPAITGGRDSYDASWWSYCDGNKVIFYDYASMWDKSSKGRLYSYYARVVSPGTFGAEGTAVQSTEAKDRVYYGSSEKITIK